MRARACFALIAAGAVVVPALSLAADGAMPVRKPGWWEMKVTISGPTPQPLHQTVHLCTDAAVDQIQTPLGLHTGKSCPPAQVSRTAAGWSFSETCVTGGMTVSTQGHASGDFSSHYQVDATTRLTPPPAPQAAETRLAIDATWLGACPVGKKPGDMEMTFDTNVAPQSN